MNIFKWYTDRKIKEAEEAIREMMDIITSDDNNPSMDDIYNILQIHLVASGYRKNIINRVLTDHWQEVYNNIKGNVDENITAIEGASS